jgi:excisionase family DNA binding protein
VDHAAKTSPEALRTPLGPLHDERALLRLRAATALYEARDLGLERAICDAMRDLEWPDQSAAEIDRVRTLFRRAAERPPAEEYTEEFSAGCCPANNDDTPRSVCNVSVLQISREDRMQSHLHKYPWRDKPAVPVEEAAELLGCSRSHVYAHVNRGTLKAVRVLEKTLISTESIAQQLDNPEPHASRKERVEAANRARLAPRAPSGRPVCELGRATV